MTSLVLSDNSQLTIDSFEKLPDKIMYPYAKPYDLQKHVFSSCHFLQSKFHLEEVRKTSEKCQQQQESLSAQLQVIFEYKLRLEKSLQQEKADHRQTRDDLTARVSEEKQFREKETQESLNKYTSLQQQYKILQSQHEDLSDECTKIRASHLQSIEDNAKLEAQLQALQSELKQIQSSKEKDLESLKLANALVVLSSTAEDGEIEVRISRSLEECEKKCDANGNAALVLKEQDSVLAEPKNDNSNKAGILSSSSPVVPMAQPAPDSNHLNVLQLPESQQSSRDKLRLPAHSPHSSCYKPLNSAFGNIRTDNAHALRILGLQFAKRQLRIQVELNTTSALANYATEAGVSCELSVSTKEAMGLLYDSSMDVVEAKAVCANSTKSTTPQINPDAVLSQDKAALNAAVHKSNIQNVPLPRPRVNADKNSADNPVGARPHLDTQDNNKKGLSNNVEGEGVGPAPERTLQEPDGNHIPQQPPFHPERQANNANNWQNVPAGVVPVPFGYGYNQMQKAIHPPVNSQEKPDGRNSWGWENRGSWHGPQPIHRPYNEVEFPQQQQQDFEVGDNPMNQAVNHVARERHNHLLDAPLDINRRPQLPGRHGGNLVGAAAGQPEEEEEKEIPRQVHNPYQYNGDYEKEEQKGDLQLEEGEEDEDDDVDQIDYGNEGGGAAKPKHLIPKPNIVHDSRRESVMVNPH
uniref:Uncharacterized protein n=1 Tax=Timema shepardi TaxID=629360 RepID=A0A7R9FUQ6_TIMSH|nr:unnamed protein product [Timema shepardi]